MRISGTEGTIAGSITRDQLESGDCRCFVPFSDVLPDNLVELSIVTYNFSHQCHCTGDTCYNYLTVKGFSEDLYMCVPLNVIAYGYRRNSAEVSILPTFQNSADFSFVLSYKGKKTGDLYFYAAIYF